MPGHLHDTAPVSGTPRRADVGTVRLGRRDTDGLLLCAEHYGAPYDLLAAALGAQPTRGDILPDLPPRLKARLFAAFDLAVLWNKPGQQATVHAEITETTLRAVPGLLDPTQDGYHDTDPGQPEPIWDLDNTPRSARVSHPLSPA